MTSPAKKDSEDSRDTLNDDRSRLSRFLLAAAAEAAKFQIQFEQKSTWVYEDDIHEG